VYARTLLRFIEKILNALTFNKGKKSARWTRKKSIKSAVKKYTSLGNSPRGFYFPYHNVAEDTHGKKNSCCLIFDKSKKNHIFYSRCGVECYRSLESSITKTLTNYSSYDTQRFSYIFF
jgi:hypothetical protein